MKSGNESIRPKRIRLRPNRLFGLLCPFRPFSCPLRLFVCLCVTAIAFSGATVEISDARAALDKFHAEIEETAKARAAKDDKAWQQHENQAQEYLRETGRLFDAAHAEKSDDIEILYEYGDVLMRLEDTDLAAELFQKIVEKTPNDAEAWRALGQCLATLGGHHAGEAVHALRRSLEIEAASPGAANTLIILGQVYRKEKLHDLARECFEKARETDPANRLAVIALAAANVGDGYIREAAEAIDALGDPGEYASQLGAMLAHGVRRFEQTRLWFPDTAENHRAYAKILLRVGRLADALLAAERAAVLNPDDYAIWNFIGDLCRQNKNTVRAREAYTRSLELKPGQPRTQEALRSLDTPQPPTSGA